MGLERGVFRWLYFGMLSSSQINVLQQCSLKYTLLSCASTLKSVPGVSC